MKKNGFKIISLSLCFLLIATTPLIFFSSVDIVKSTFLIFLLYLIFLAIAIFITHKFFFSKNQRDKNIESDNDKQLKKDTKHSIVIWSFFYFLFSLPSLFFLLYFAFYNQNYSSIISSIDFSILSFSMHISMIMSIYLMYVAYFRKQYKKIGKYAIIPFYVFFILMFIVGLL